MSQTEQTSGNSTGEVERVRKVYARDIKVGDAVHTVFKAGGKERHTTRAGKTFIGLELFDKTGTLEARVFDQVDVLEKAFVDDDYLLVKGKAIVFHGKPQIVIEQLERLDPEPIDPREFVAPPKSEAPARAEPPARQSGGHKQLRQRLNALLDDPEVASGLNALLRHLEQYVDERVAARLNGEKPERPERHRHDEPRKPKGQRPPVEVKPRVEGEGKEHKPARDPSLARELAFKPFTELVATQTPPAAAETAPVEGAVKPQADS